MISWANKKVASVGKKTTAKDFRDKTLGDSLFLIDLLYAMDPSGMRRGGGEERGREEREGNGEREDSKRHLLRISAKTLCDSLFLIDSYEE
jgi:hypothetical protein